MRALRIPEAAFQAQVISYARLRRWLVMHTRPAQDKHGRWKTPLQGDPGFPDLVLARDGRLILAELKSDAGMVGNAQARWREAILPIVDFPGETATHAYYLWRPSDWPTVEQVLR